MKYKPGDEVFVKAEITDISDCEERPYFVAPDCRSIYWVSEDKIIPADKTYADGLSDAWELAKKIDLFDNEERTKIFGYLTSEYIKEHYTVQEALAKIEAYEKEKEIKVGDVVVIDDENFLVTKVTKTAPTITIDGMRSDGDIICYSDRQFKKTGKHIDIESLLRQIGE